MARYYLLSQNRIAKRRIEELKDSSPDDDMPLFIGNWNLESVRSVADITPEKLGNPTKNQGEYALLLFKWIQKGDRIVVAESKRSIFGIWTVTQTIQAGPNEGRHYMDTEDSTIFVVRIQWDAKILGSNIQLSAENEIREFRKTLSELTPPRFKEIFDSLPDSAKEYKDWENIGEVHQIEIALRSFFKTSTYRMSPKVADILRERSEDLKGLAESKLPLLEAIEKLFDIIGEPLHYTFVAHTLLKYGLVTTKGKTFEDSISSKLSTNRAIFTPQEKGYYVAKKSIVKIIKELRNELFISEGHAYGLLVSLETSNFVILSGPSGSGKSQCIREIAKILNGEDRNGRVDGYLKFPVKSNFTDETAVLGYWNPLLSRYESTEALEFLIQSARTPDKPFFLLLDEMNLSRIENYFSEFLARLDELKDPNDSAKIGRIPLFETAIDSMSKLRNVSAFIGKFQLEESYELKRNDADTNLEDLLREYQGMAEEEANEALKHLNVTFKAHVRICKNLRVIGTINEDETTQSLSNKVLDRAQYVTFEINDLFGNGQESQFSLPNRKCEMIDCKYVPYSELSRQSPRFWWIFSNPIEFPTQNEKSSRTFEFFVTEVNERIRSINPNESIWYRAIADMANFIHQYSKGSRNDGTDSDVMLRSFDIQISQKVLTKLKTFNIQTDTQRQAFVELWKLCESFNTAWKKRLSTKEDSHTLKFFRHLEANFQHE